MNEIKYKALLAQRQKKTAPKPIDRLERRRRNEMLIRRNLWKQLRKGERVNVSFYEGKFEGVAIGLDKNFLVIAEVSGHTASFKPKDVRRAE